MVVEKDVSSLYESMGPRKKKYVRVLVPLSILLLINVVGAYLALGIGNEPDEATASTQQRSDTSVTTAAEDNGSAVAGDAAPTAAPDGDEVVLDESAMAFESSYVTGIAAAVSQEIFPDGQAENIILATQTPTGDALAAGSLVGLFDTTLLLTHPDELSTATAAEIDRLGTPRVHILGGPDAVSPEIVDDLAAAGHDTHRHAGPVQASTAVDIAGAHFPEADTAVLVQTPRRGQSPAGAISSALSATAYAASRDLPMLLTAGDTLTDETDEYLEGAQIDQIVVVGEENQISDEVTGRLRELGIDWIRWSGETRFHTAVEIAQNRGFQTPADAEVVVLVEGEHDSVWPAGFLGAIQASQENGPVLLTQGAQLPAATAEYLIQGSGGDTEVICTPGVTRAACAEATRLVGSG